MRKISIRWGGGGGGSAISIRRMRESDIYVSSRTRASSAERVSVYKRDTFARCIGGYSRHLRDGHGEEREE